MRLTSPRKFVPAAFGASPRTPLGPAAPGPRPRGSAPAPNAALRLLLLALLAGGGLLAGTQALAAPVKRGAAAKAAPAADPKAEKTAREHFRNAERAFNLGKFEEALAAYEAAYEALPLPAFLFNVGQCHRNLGQHERAVFFYQRYLSLEPQAGNRGVVESLIAEEQKRLDQARAAAAPEPEPASVAARAPSLSARPPEPRGRGDGPMVELAPRSAPPAKAERFYPKWWFWGVLAGVGVGGLAAFMIAGRGELPRGKLGTIDAR